MLTFLKIIGTILLVVLLVILVVLLLVLFVPFRYSLEFDYGKDKMHVKTRVTWLLMFRFYLSFIDKKLAYKFKVLFFNILNSERVKKPKVAKQKVSKGEEKVEKPSETEGVTEEETAVSGQTEPEIVTSQEQVKKEAVQTESSQELNAKSRKKFSFKLLHPAEIYYIVSQKVADMYWKVRHSIIMAFSKIDKICAMIADPDNREAVVFVLSQVKALLKHVLPTKHGIYVKAGFADPATTGQALGAYSVINNILGLNFVFEPDFDNEVLEAKVFVRGRIRVINLAIIGIKVITNKTIRKFIRRK